MKLLLCKWAKVWVERNSSSQTVHLKNKLIFRYLTFLFRLAFGLRQGAFRRFPAVTDHHTRVILQLHGLPQLHGWRVSPHRVRSNLFLKQYVPDSVKAQLEVENKKEVAAQLEKEKVQLERKREAAIAKVQNADKLLAQRDKATADVLKFIKDSSTGR